MAEPQLAQFVSPAVEGTALIAGIGASEVLLQPMIGNLGKMVGAQGTTEQIIGIAIQLTASMFLLGFAAKQKDLIGVLLVGASADFGFRAVEGILNLLGIKQNFGVNLSF
jgi:hypothetical protein